MLLARFDRPLDLPRDERVALLGGKGDGLMRMAGELALPVPPGFILTTRACALHREQGWTDALEQVLREGIAGARGADGAPLRRGRRTLRRARAAARERPLRCPRLDARHARHGPQRRPRRRRRCPSFARENARLAEECRARLADSFRATVGAPPPADAWSQLRAAVLRRLPLRRLGARPGLSPPRRAHGRIRHRRERPGDGLRQSRPALGDRRLLHARSRDRRESPLRRRPLRGPGRGRRLGPPRDPDPRRCSNARSPTPRASSSRSAASSNGRYRDLCEIEFTIESGKLWLLQVRVGKAQPPRRAADRGRAGPRSGFPARSRARRSNARARCWSTRPRSIIASHTRCDDRARSGPSLPSPAASVRAPASRRARSRRPSNAPLARAAAGHAVLLVRPETSPDDVEGMAVATGLLTSRGGLASHAAVVARGWGIPAVVGLAALAIDDAGLDARRSPHRRRRDACRSTARPATSTSAPCEIERRVVPEAAPLARVGTRARHRAQVDDKPTACQRTRSGGAALATASRRESDRESATRRRGASASNRSTSRTRSSRSSRSRAVRPATSSPPPSRSIPNPSRPIDRPTRHRRRPRRPPGPPDSD